MSTNSGTFHIACTSQVHTCSNFSEKQIESVSQSLSASANYFRKLVEGDTKASTPQNDEKKTTSNSTEQTTVTVHADATFKDILIGFTEYDSKDVDTEAYSVKRAAYDSVRQKYPKLDDLIRDEKVKALKELKTVGFKYYTINVTAFIVKDGLTRTVCSKSHHRLERPSKDYLERILVDTFKGSIRPEDKNTSGLSVDTAGDESPNV
jgi:hypothetical protein